MRLPRPLFLALRTLLYLLLTLLLIRGAATLLPKVPQAEAAKQPEATKVAEPDPPGLQALPALFAADYLTWDSANQAERATRLEPYLAPGLDPQAGWRPGATASRQSVQGAWVLQTKPDGPGRWLATVAASVHLETTVDAKPVQQSRTLYLSVPLAKTKANTLVVAGLPALVPTPAGPGAPTNALEGAEAKDDRAAPLLHSFFTAYFSGGDTRYFLTKEAAPTGAPTGFTLKEIGKAALRKSGDRLTAEIPVTAQDGPSGATFTFRYSLVLTEQEGRLYILDLQQKGA